MGRIMFCRQCGTKNEAGSRFCEACGTKMIVPKKNHPAMKSKDLRKKRPESDRIAKNIKAPRQRRPADESQRSRAYEVTDIQNEKLTHKRKKPLLIVVGILLLVAILLTGWVFIGVQTTRAFNDAMEEGNRYLLAENLEQAEAHFLRAIEIRPREVEPYLQLADIYMTWDEPEEAIAILEQGLEAVAERDRAVLEEALDEVHEFLAREPSVEEAPEEPEDEEISPFYLALIAFHSFLSNPQSMEFQLFAGGSEETTVSWDVNSLRHAELVDFNGDGVPELLIIPPREDIQMCVPFAIIGYSGQIDVLFKTISWGDAGSSVIHDLAITSDGRKYLMRSMRESVISLGGSSVTTNIFFTLSEGEFIPAFETERVREYELIEVVRDGNVFTEWEDTSTTYLINSNPVNADSMDEILYEEFSIVEIRGFMLNFDESNDINILLAYIEERLEAAGILFENMDGENQEEVGDPYVMYQEIFQRYQGTAGLQYGFYDIDGNGTPELILYLQRQDGMNERTGIIQIYTWNDGGIISLLDEEVLQERDLLAIRIFDTGYIKKVYARGPRGHMQLDFYRIRIGGEGLESISSFGEYRSHNPETLTTDQFFRYNDETGLTEEEWHSAINRYTNTVANDFWQWESNINVQWWPMP